MRRVALMVLLSIAVVLVSHKAAAADKETHFTSKPAASYPGHQVQDMITIAAAPFTREDEVKEAFGKANPYKWGVLPVLVVIRNDTPGALRLNLKVELVDIQNNRANPMKPLDVRLWDGARNKDYRIPQSINPIPLPRRKSHGPLDVPEIDGLAFSAKLLPAANQVFGFFYFDSSIRPGDHIYISGLSDASSGKEYFYFEVPFEDQKP